MIADRFGYFENGYHYWPGILRSAEFYGFEQDDPVYRERLPFEKGRVDCPVCRIHDERERRFPCDVMLARAADMEAAGYPATFCRSCCYAMPVRKDQEWWQAECWHCERQERQVRSRGVRGGSVRVDDGFGCSERLPSWMVDWDGDLGHSGGPAY